MKRPGDEGVQYVQAGASFAEGSGEVQERRRAAMQPDVQSHASLVAYSQAGCRCMNAV